MTISQGLNDKIVTRWGSVANWKMWVRASTKADIYNAALNSAEINARALVEVARVAADAVDATL
jgi:hypothetical protein